MCQINIVFPYPDQNYGLDCRGQLPSHPVGEPCREFTAAIVCPCCDGRAEHNFGTGPNGLDYPCNLCGGEGKLAVSRIKRDRKTRQRVMPGIPTVQEDIYQATAA